MTEEGDASNDTAAGHELVDVLAEEFAERYRRGENPSVEAYARDHPALAAQIRALFPTLIAMEQAGRGGSGKAAPPGAVIGSHVGHYKLLERLGEGGFGVVYMAEQSQPIRRKVALKVIKPGLDTGQVIARFEAERQALAMMDHENIAKVLDAGATDAGRPYFVMELVPGLPITQFCDEHALAPRERLALFMQVCRAVQHAHTKGVIHRDIKPTNVLVAMHDGKAVPKVIDFGVAKATHQSLTEKTLFTQFTQLVGTPLYMSPEQAEMGGMDVDTRSDVYSLGVMLYELLTGTTPFDKDRLKEVAIDEIRRIIREEEPPKPSTRLSESKGSLPSISAQRHTEPAKLTRLVRGELDWIVMKALEKDRARRYDSANSLAADVDRYLTDEAVQACPPSVAYRVRKFARRNRRTLITFGLLAVMLLATAVSLGWAARDRSARRTEAERKKQAREAQALGEADQALREAATLRDRNEIEKAHAAVKRAEWLLVEGFGQSLRDRAKVMTVDLEMMSRLDAIRTGDSLGGVRIETANKDQSRRMAADQQYAEEFKKYGIDVGAVDAREAAKRIGESAIRDQLVAAIDDWLWNKLRYVHNWDDLIRLQAQDTEEERNEAIKRLNVSREKKLSDYGRLRAVADLVDPNDLCKRFRDPAVHYDRAKMEALADDPAVAGLRPSAAILLARVTGRTAAYAKCLEVLFKVHFRVPDDFAMIYEIAYVLSVTNRDLSRRHEAAGFLRAAVALRPRSAALHATLGDHLAATDVDQSIAAYRNAFELHPPRYVHDLIRAMDRKAGWQQRTASDAHVSVLMEWVAREPNHAWAHSQLGDAHRQRREWEKALAAYREAARLAPNVTASNRDLAWLLATVPQPELRNYSEALEMAEALPVALQKLQPTIAVARYRLGDWPGAIAALEGHQVDGAAPFVRAMAHWRLGQPKEAHHSYARGAQRAAIISRLLADETDAFAYEAAALLGVQPTPPLTPDEADLNKAFDTAASLLMAGDVAGYRQLCARLVEHIDELKPARHVETRRPLGRICVMAPDALADPFLQYLLATSGTRQGTALFLHLGGLGQYRNRNDAKAIEFLERSMKMDAKWPGHAQNWLVLAMAHHRLNHPDEARRWLDKASGAIDADRKARPQAPTALGMTKEDWMICQLLRREAEALINGTKK